MTESVDPSEAAPTITTAGDSSTAPSTRVDRAGRKQRGILDVILVVAAAVALAGVAFAIGRTTAPPITSAGSVRGSFGAGGDTGAGAGAGGSGRAGRGGAFAIEGSVVAVTSDNLTLRLASGQTVQVPLSSTTTYHRSRPATSRDVATGSQVLVQFAPRVPGSPDQGGGGATGSGSGQVLPGQSPAAAGQGAQGELRFLSGAATEVTVVGQ